MRAAGAVLLGPNCLGVFDASSDLGIASNEFPEGAIGLVSQSGNLSLELGILARQVGLGFSRFASVGNQADVDLAELVAAFAEHPADRGDLRLRRGLPRRPRLRRRGRRRRQAGGAHDGRRIGGERPRRPVAHRRARSSDVAVVAAAARAAGVHLVRTPHEMIDLVQALVRTHPLRGPRIAVVGDGGGHGAIACDVASAAGLELPRLSDALSAELAGPLPETAATRNPVDLAGGGEQDFHSYARVVARAARVGRGRRRAPDRVLRRLQPVLRDVRRARGRRRAQHHRSPWPRRAGRWSPTRCTRGSPTAEALREGGVPVYTTIEAAAAALAGLRARPPAAGAPVLPPRADRADRAGLLRQPGAARGGRRAVRAGDPCAHPRARREAAAGELGYPVVVKAVDALHKSDAGGVVVGIADRGRAAWQPSTRLTGRLAPAELSVERMAPLHDGVELIVGARVDPRFGPVAMVGLGGIHTEVFGDVAVDLAPVDAAAAERLLRSLRGRVASDRHPRPAAARHRRGGGGRGARSRIWRRPGPTWPRSRSTRCSSPPRGRSRSTRA